MMGLNGVVMLGISIRFSKQFIFMGMHCDGEKQR